MKLALDTDFTRIPRAGSFIRAGEASHRARPAPFDSVVLPHDERHLRRKVLKLAHGEKILVDLLEPVALGHGDLLVLDDGRHAVVVAAGEEVYDVRGRDAVHLAQLAWHIGNRHLAAQIEEHRILILRDHVIKAMLEGLSAKVTEVVEPFVPLRGAYSGHAHGHGPQPDAYGRLPGDPHYGHDHGPGEHHHHDDHHHHDHDHDHDHGHHDHSHEHHGEPDRFGRLPGDPHYGHDHA